jgi:hypothetical protein
MKVEFPTLTKKKKKTNIQKPFNWLKKRFSFILFDAIMRRQVLRQLPALSVHSGRMSQRVSCRGVKWCHPPREKANAFKREDFQISFSCHPWFHSLFYNLKPYHLYFKKKKKKKKKKNLIIFYSPSKRANPLPHPNFLFFHNLLIRVWMTL